GLRRGGEGCGRAIAFGIGRGGGIAPHRQREARRLTARVERCELRGYRRRAGLQRGDLIAIEVELVLLAVDGQLARVRRLPRLSRPRLGLDELDAQAAQIGVELADARRRHRLALACLAEPRTRRLDGPGELTVFPGKEYLLP